MSWVLLTRDSKFRNSNSSFATVLVDQQANADNSQMSSSPPREPHLLRFRLRQLFLFVTGLSVLLAALVLTEGPWPLVIIVSTLLIAAHVFGTMVGNRLRDTSHDVLQWRSVTPGVDQDVPRAEKEITQQARSSLPPTTPLASSGRVSRWLIWFVLGGAIAGMILGGSILWLTLGSKVGWAGWIVGTISCGVLGTWVAFLASSFSTIARHAWLHASEKGD